MRSLSYNRYPILHANLALCKNYTWLHRAAHTQQPRIQNIAYPVVPTTLVAAGRHWAKHSNSARKLPRAL